MPHTGNIEAARASPYLMPGITGNRRRGHTQPTAQSQMQSIVNSPQSITTPPQVETEWNANYENIMMNYRKRCKMYSWKYMRTAFYAGRTQSRLSIISGLLGGLVGTSGLISVVGSSDGDNEATGWTKYATLGIGYIIGILSLLNSNWNLTEIQGKALKAQSELSNIANKIEIELVKKRIDRVDASDMMSSVAAEYNKIIDSSPMINPRVDEEYRRYCRDNLETMNISEDDILLDERQRNEPERVMHAPSVNTMLDAMNLSTDI